MPLELPGENGVSAVIAAMAAAVQRGDFEEAERLGASAPLPLSLPRHALRLGRAISEGAQAAVREALLALPGQPPLPVAVKTPRIGVPADLARFWSEVGLLARLQHPALVRLVGARMLPPDYCMVLGLEATNAAAELHRAGWRPAWGEVVALGAQLAGALAHMHGHGHGVAHRDVKPANILLCVRRQRARLADLGLAARLEELQEGAGGVGAGGGGAKPSGGFHKQHMVGTLEYLAPEVLLGGRHSCASDVYAAAVTLAELASGAPPFSDCTRDNPLAHTVLEMGYGRQELAAAVAAEGLRPTLPPGTLAALRALLEACWACAPADRPSAEAFQSRLEQLAGELCCCPSPAEDVAAPAGEAGAALPAQPPQPAPARAGSAAGLGGVVAGQQREQQLQEPGVGVGKWVGGGSSPAASTARASVSPPPTPEPGEASPAAGGGGGRWGTEPPAWLAHALAAQREAALVPAPAVAGFESAGARGADRMEDRHVLLKDLGGWEGVTVMAVFDGHRGVEAAEYLAANLGWHLWARWGSAASAGDLLAGALADADAAFCVQQDTAWAERVAAMAPQAAGHHRFPGSTAIVALVAGSLLAVANLGDSRAVLCRGGKALQLTQDQTAERADERARVAAAGGVLRHVMGSWRVGQAGMQVTRSVGDFDLKGHGGLSCDAEVAELELSVEEDAFLVLATDGVWDQLSSEEVVGLLRDTVKQPAMCAQV